MKATPDYIIAIDPDATLSGWANLHVPTKRCEVATLSFPLLIDELINLHKYATVMNFKIRLIVEAGWLNEAHWHLKSSDSKRLAAAKGNAVGRNHETGRKIIEMAKHIGFEVEEVRPLKKGWKGPGGKITHEELSYFITEGLPKRTNQEQRDAALLAWYYANFPIKVKSI